MHSSLHTTQLHASHELDRMDDKKKARPTYKEALEKLDTDGTFILSNVGIGTELSFKKGKEILLNNQCL